MATPVRAFPWARLALTTWLCGALGLVTGGLLGHEVSGWLGAALLFAIAATIALGIFFAQLGLFARPIVAADAQGAAGRLALTFDDGPDPETTTAILTLLESRGHRGTFFVIGRKVQPGLLAEIARRGHGLANHSFEHLHSTPFLPPRRLAEDLGRAEALLTEARGIKGRWFRAPVGIVSPRVARAAELAGLELVSWTRSARDGTARATVDEALARLRPALRPGAILVLHDGAERDDRRPIAPAVLARLLDELDQRGLRSVTLDELLT